MGGQCPRGKLPPLIAPMVPPPKVSIQIAIHLLMWIELNPDCTNYWDHALGPSILSFVVLFQRLFCTEFVYNSRPVPSLSERGVLLSIKGVWLTYVPYKFICITAAERGVRLNPPNPPCVRA